MTDSEGPVSEDIMVPAQPDDNAIRVDREAVDGQHHRVRVDRHADRSQHCERDRRMHSSRSRISRPFGSSSIRPQSPWFVPVVYVDAWVSRSASRMQSCLARVWQP